MAALLSFKNVEYCSKSEYKAADVISDRMEEKVSGREP